MLRHRGKGPDDVRPCFQDGKACLQTFGPACACLFDGQGECRTSRVDDRADRRSFHDGRQYLPRERPDKFAQITHQRHLPGSGYLEIECLEGLPQAFRIEQFTGGKAGGGQLRGIRPGFVAQLVDEGGAHAVDQPVNQLRGDDFTFQRVVGQLFAAFPDQLWREVIDQQLLEFRRIR